MAEGVININPTQADKGDGDEVPLALGLPSPRTCQAQGQFQIYWHPGKSNLTDYFTKHHPPAHHVNVQAEFLPKIKDLPEARTQRQKMDRPHHKITKS